MHKIKLNDEVYEVDFNSPTNQNSGTINKKSFDLDIVQRNELQYHLIKDNKSYCVDILNINYETKEIKLKLNGHVYEGTVEDDLDVLLKEMGIETKSKSVVNELHAPMPGMVLAINVEKGQKVEKGGTLIVLEAMKMENNLKADSEVVIKEIHCKKADTVDKNQLLISFE